MFGYIAYDPQEDTETPTLQTRRFPKKHGYIAYDPQEDTETLKNDNHCSSMGFVTSPTIRKRILKLVEQAIAQAEQSTGYIAYDPQEDTETHLRPEVC